MAMELEEEQVVSLAVATACIIDCEDVDDYLAKKKPKRTHKCWQRPWLRARNDREQANTVYKLQRELLQVNHIIDK